MPSPQRIEPVFRFTNLRVDLTRLFRVPGSKGRIARVVCSLFEAVSRCRNHWYTTQRCNAIKIDHSVLWWCINENASPRLFPSGSRLADSVSQGLFSWKHGTNGPRVLFSAACQCTARSLLCRSPWRLILHKYRTRDPLTIELSLRITTVVSPIV